MPTAVAMAAEVLRLPVQLVGRLPGDAHWHELAALEPDIRDVLAGPAATVNHLLRQLR
ncbi:hypothetical protein H5407_19915 [Mitsuaria sp. WAJ17]|uniref:hypothetical protein n=1 Tax=Mitsuaria sp. WAJ17 TaxID=2761452 RepID=UPI0015FF7468|nr:hypothetical protein [Mitsuaria sp. WAJ17]MBB2487507.1 hypothetical protein [Mitsuaria sp. WAJ17]